MLQINCKEKKLCVNISKSKIVVFHANKSKTSLMYNNCVLEEVDCFNYLGLTWHRKRNMHYAQQIIVKQTTRANAVLDAHLSKHKNMPVDMIFLLFDTLVRPILLFNCEFWGFKISTELELYHLKLKKSMLGVKTTTNTCLVYIETCRYPLYVTIYKLIIKYWLKLIVTPKHRYIYVVSKKSVNCCFLFVKKLLFQYGFGYVWETQATFIDHKLFIEEFELRIMDIFKQTCFADTTNINRCFLYNALDRDFTMANYLNNITIQSNRKAMAQLRLSSHKLMIERGRWKKIVHKERTCLHCQVLEDEYHVVIVFPKYTVIRKQYFKP